MEDNVKNNIYAKNIRLLRKHKDLNQEQMGEILELKQSGYSGIERGVSYLSIPQMIKLVEVFNVNLNWLICGVGDMYLMTAEEEAESEMLDKQIWMLVKSLRDDVNYIYKHLGLKRDG